MFAAFNKILLLPKVFIGLWVHLRPSWGLLGATWGHLGAILGHLGASGGHVGIKMHWVSKKINVTNGF